MEYLFLVLIIITSIVNRLRGTGDIFTIGKVRITGVQVYALYIAIAVGIITSWYWGLLGAALFIVGESFAWGKWVGYLVSDNGEKEYWNLNGQNFPYIHQIANFIVQEREDYLWYCRTALAIRGFIWFAPLFLLLAYTGLTSYTLAVILSVLLGICFPLSCSLGKIFDFKYQSRYLMVNTNWERQEIFYGLFQGVALTLILI